LVDHITQPEPREVKLLHLTIVTLGLDKDERSLKGLFKEFRESRVHPTIGTFW
jgi:hypothetical protein